MTIPTPPHRHAIGITRRELLQVGYSGLLGVGLANLPVARAAGSKPAGLRPPLASPKSVIIIFQTGAASHIDTLDPKPDAPAEIRGEFTTIATKTPGMLFTEHLPLLAARSEKWALVRSLTHKSNDHSLGHHLLLTGRGDAQLGFNPSLPKPSDHPSMASVAGAVSSVRNNLPPAVVLPDRIVNNTVRTLPGQFGGVMGRARDPWFIEASGFDPYAYGAYPEFEFDHQDRPYTPKRKGFQVSLLPRFT